MEQFWSEKELEGFDDYCDYLRDRGINKETAKRLQILYDPMMEEVLFPVRNKTGIKQLFYLGGRYAEEEEVRKEEV